SHTSPGPCESDGYERAMLTCRGTCGVAADGGRDPGNAARQDDAEFIVPGVCRTGHLTEPKRAWKRIIDRAKLRCPCARFTPDDLEPAATPRWRVDRAGEPYTRPPRQRRHSSPLRPSRRPARAVSVSP